MRMTHNNSPAGHCAQHQPQPALDYTLNFPGLTPEALGFALFQRVYHCTRMAAEHYAPSTHTISATYDPVTHERTGYRVVVPNALTGLRVRLSYDLARQCKRMPWVTE